jgi:hypothetical protein
MGEGRRLRSGNDIDVLLRETSLMSFRAHELSAGG